MTINPTDIARQAAASEARNVIGSWPNKDCRTLSLAYVDTILGGGNDIPEGLASQAVTIIDDIFKEHGITVRQKVAAVKIHSTSTPSDAKKGKAA